MVIMSEKLNKQPNNNYFKVCLPQVFIFQWLRRSGKSPFQISYDLEVSQEIFVHLESSIVEKITFAKMKQKQ